MKPTPQEIEDAKYHFWQLNDGPRKSTLKEAEKAESTFAALEAEGWEILSKRLVKPISEDISQTELVVRRGNDARVLTWKYSKWWTPCAGGGSAPLEDVLNT